MRNSFADLIQYFQINWIHAKAMISLVFHVSTVNFVLFLYDLKLLIIIYSTNAKNKTVATRWIAQYTKCHLFKPKLTG